MTSVASNGITIEYEERGSGPPLLMVMGLGGQLTDWPDGLLDLLAEKFRVIVYDNRDIGLSTETDGEPPTTKDFMKAQVLRRRLDAPYQLTDMAQDGIGLLDVLGIEAAHVVGMSMGGMIAQTMAIEHPSRVLSLVSVMSNPGDGKSGAADPKVMWKLSRRPETTRETAVADTLATFAMISGSAWDADEHRIRTQASLERSFRPKGTMRQLAAIGASPDRTEALGSVTAPTLVIHGLADTLVRKSGGIATAKAVPGSRLLMFADMGHDLPATRWLEIADAIAANAHRAAPVGIS